MKPKKLVSIKDGIKILNEAYGLDREEIGRDVYSPQTIYNAIYKRVLKRYGPKHFVMLDVDELLSVFGPKRAG